jgi:hypothetical protein
MLSKYNYNSSASQYHIHTHSSDGKNLNISLLKNIPGHELLEKLHVIHIYEADWNPKQTGS